MLLDTLKTLNDETSLVDLHTADRNSIESILSIVYYIEQVASKDEK